MPKSGNGAGVSLGALCVMIAWARLVPLHEETPPGADPRRAPAGRSLERSVEQFIRAVRTAVAACVVASSYALTSTFSSPQVLQANRPPSSDEWPTAHGGGYCFRPPCDAFFGTFKSPLWRNPTNVVGTPATTAPRPEIRRG